MIRGIFSARLLQDVGFSSIHNFRHRGNNSFSFQQSSRFLMGMCISKAKVGDYIFLGLELLLLSLGLGKGFGVGLGLGLVTLGLVLGFGVGLGVGLDIYKTIFLNIATALVV